VGKDLRGALPAGARLRGYEILAVLGHGGFGVTYQARDTTLGRDVAIKEYLPTAVAIREDGTTVLPRSTALADEFRWGRDRFLQEARTLAKLDGAPAIVRVFDFLEANGTAYMVMALLDGESLEQRLRRDGCLSQPAIERLLYPLLDGLAAVHAAGFLHRDIKPDNIMLDAKSAPTDRFRRLARAAGRRDGGDDGDLHAGLRRGRAIHVCQARSMDRHLRPVRHALSRHRRSTAAQRLRPHGERYL
jgi:serine/threonine protein kinase